MWQSTFNLYTYSDSPVKRLSHCGQYFWCNFTVTSDLQSLLSQHNEMLQMAHVRLRPHRKWVRPGTYMPLLNVRFRSYGLWYYKLDRALHTCFRQRCGAARVYYMHFAPHTQLRSLSTLLHIDQCTRPLLCHKTGPELAGFNFDELDIELYIGEVKWLNAYAKIV